ncbi:hypothetical protein J002_03346 [Cryptococcus neoformans]|nr:hypothetical protein J002_03346 [Cryptococcus neoformans var. grubii]
MLAHGTRPSRVIGGFETSSEGESAAGGGPSSSSGTGMATPGAKDASHSDSTWRPDPSKRAQLPSSETAEVSRTPGTVPKGRLDKRPKRKASIDTSDRPPSRTSKGRSPSLRSHLSARSDGGHAVQNGNGLAARGRTASSRSQHDPAARPKRQGSMSPANSKPVDWIKHGGERTSSSEGRWKDKGKGRDTTTEKVVDDDDDDRERKQQLGTADTLAESLGLNGSGLNIKGVSLNTDQIHSLLSDSDLASAIRLMNDNNNAISPRVPFSSSVADPYNHSTASTADPPSHVSPYLVSAPPPLTNDSPNPHGRERAVSAASSIVPATPATTWSPHFRSTFQVPDGHGHGLGAQRQRSVSRASMSAELPGGHIPFTHHLPAVPQVNEEDSDEGSMQGAPGTLETARPVQEQSLSRDEEGKKKKKKKKMDRKSGLSGLFHFGRRGSNDSNDRSPRLKEKEHPWRADRYSEEHARDREAREREEEMRRIEWEKRQEEIMQDRRYRALTQVAAHPNAERLAYRTGAHLRAYYQHVYDCIENPPRLNFPKMLRWLTETDKQNALRAQYYASRHQNDANHTHEHEQANNNARSAGSSSRVNLSSSQRSVGSGRTHSISSNRRSHDVSPQKRVPDLVIPRRGWRYTVDDIQAFRDSGGVVNYFVPPRQVRPFNDDADENEEGKSVSPQTIANRVEHGLNKTYGHQRATTPQSQSKDIDRHRDDNSSAAGSSKKGHLYEFSSRTANNTASNVSLADMDQSMREANLSRSTSFDTGGDKSVSGRRDHRISHRSHQSLSAVGHSSLGHALKQPFEKLSSVTKKQRTMPHFHPYSDRGDRGDRGDRENSHINDFAPSPDHPGVALSGSSSLSPQRAGLVSRDSTGSATNKSSVGQARNNASSNRLKEPSFFKRHGLAGHEPVTDEEGGRLKLFIKGTRKTGLDDHKKRLGKNCTENLAECREEELKEAERIYAREQQFKNNQLQAEEEKAKVTKTEEAALIKILDLEKDIYQERAQHLITAKDRLAVVSSNIYIIDEAIRQYLTQIDFARDEAKISMDLEADWSLVEPLNTKYNRRRSAESDELRDTVPPLHSFGSGDSNSDGGRSQPRPIVRRNRSRTSSSRSRSGSVSVSVPKRTLSLQNSIGLNHIDPLQARHHPRRTYLAPDGLTRVDPVRHAELMIAFGKKREEEVGKEKEDMAREMEKMIGQIEAMIRQKEEVRHWVADVLERAGNAKTQLERLRIQEDSFLDFVHFAEQRDRLVDSITKGLGFTIRVAWYVFQWVKVPCKIIKMFFHPIWVIATLIFSAFSLPWTALKLVTGRDTSNTIDASEDPAIGRQRRRRGISIMWLTGSALSCVIAVFFWYYGTDG